MRLDNPRHAEFGLIRDMLATPDLIAAFDPAPAVELAQRIGATDKVLFTGEGSSRIFPSKHAIYQARRAGDGRLLHTEAGLQARQYKLDDWAVLGVSNSGRTSEVVRLFQQLRGNGHPHLYSLSAAERSMIESLAARGWTLKCGKEQAVAATKSVIEQALFCHTLVDALAGRPTFTPGQLLELSQAFRTALALPLSPELCEHVAGAGRIFFAGPNTGVAEELTLKTNEITRRPSDYLEGTYAVHGIEEVMSDTDVLVWIAPDEDSEEKFHEVLVRGVGMTVITIAHRPTRFPTLRVPHAQWPAYVELAVGWNLLVETGLRLDIDLDRPTRARKVGNEFVG